MLSILKYLRETKEKLLPSKIKITIEEHQKLSRDSYKLSIWEWYAAHEKYYFPDSGKILSMMAGEIIKSHMKDVESLVYDEGGKEYVQQIQQQSK